MGVRLISYLFMDHAVPDGGEPPLSAAGKHAMEPVTLVQLGFVDVL